MMIDDFNNIKSVVDLLHDPNFYLYLFLNLDKLIFIAFVWKKTQGFMHKSFGISTMPEIKEVIKEVVQEENKLLHDKIDANTEMNVQQGAERLTFLHKDIINNPEAHYYDIKVMQFFAIYKAYKALGGNSFVDKLKDEVEDHIIKCSKGGKK